jgi:hypothetical protein
MRRAAVAWLVLAALSAGTYGDRVSLKDGRTFEGAVTRSEDKIHIEMAYGQISFAASEVASIQSKPTAADQLEMQLKITRRDPNALFQVAQWARENDLAKRSDEILQQVVGLDPDHAAARKLLGFVQVDTKWVDLATAIRLAKGRLAADKHEHVLADMIQPMDEAAADPKAKLAVKDLEAQCRLRLGQFDKARALHEELGGKAAAPDSLRYAAIAGILKDCPDGMYVLEESYPPTAMLLDSPAPQIEAGPASLRQAEVLQAALRDKAKDYIKAGKAVMEEGKKLENTEPEAAKAKYALANRSFDTADALAPTIARNYRVEIVRRRVGMITKGMNVEAEKFDTMKAELGKRDMTPVAYRELINRMLSALNRVRNDLNSIMQLAGPFERELVLEMTDAKLRLQHVDALRDVLNQELHGNAPK